MASSTGQRVLFGAFEHFVSLFDVCTGKQSEVIRTTFDYGGDRLALTDELNGVVAAAYHVHGLAFYAGDDGRELWRRKDIKKVQRMRLSRDGLFAYCGVEGSSLAQIDLRTGETKRRHRGIKLLADSPYDPVQFLDGSRPAVVNLQGDARLFVGRTTFAFLDVCFGPGAVVLSEAGGPVRCIDLTKRRERWRYVPPPDNHVLEISYREQGGGFVGVEWPYVKGGARKLLEFCPESGSIRKATALETCACCFALRGSVIVTSTGRVIDTVTQSEVHVPGE